MVSVIYADTFNQLIICDKGCSAREELHTHTIVHQSEGILYFVAANERSNGFQRGYMSRYMKIDAWATINGAKLRYLKNDMIENMINLQHLR
jgi:hypothetical protein